MLIKRLVEVGSLAANFYVCLIDQSALFLRAKPLPAQFPSYLPRILLSPTGRLWSDKSKRRIRPSSI